MNGTSAFYNHTLLCAGLSTLVRGIAFPGQAEKAISQSFDLAVTGLGAARGGLYLLRQSPCAAQLEVLCSFGMTEQQIREIESRRDLQDVRPGQIWGLVSRVLPHPTPEAQSLPERRFSHVHPKLYVVCTPVYDPIVGRPIAFLHFEKETVADPEFEAVANAWIDTFSLTLGQIIQLGLPPASADNKSNHGDIETLENAPELIGESVQTQALRHELHEIYIPAASAPDPDPILILGEKGTGKDLVARYIYAYSARRNRPYVAVNCAEITDELATARFFGHKKGSFTGSMANEPGLFRAADHGVLFLDEIGDLSLKSQGTLLRVLENRTVVPLGETKEQKVDVQVILGTNRDPEQAVAQGLMRPDLLDRFCTQAIRLAPLRERPWDIPALVRYFIAFHEKRTQKKLHALHGDVLKMMVGYPWPGNVRELGRVCSLLISHIKPGMAIDAALLNRIMPHIARGEWNPNAGVVMAGDIPMREALEIFGRELILSRLRQHNWNIKSARESLGLPKTTFRRYARALGIDNPVRGGTMEPSTFASEISAGVGMPAFG